MTRGQAWTCRDHTDSNYKNTHALSHTQIHTPWNCRDVVVDNKLHFRDVQTSRRHVRGKQEARLAGLELAEGGCGTVGVIVIAVVVKVVAPAVAAVAAMAAGGGSVANESIV
jgi:hypothetical protein